MEGLGSAGLAADDAQVLSSTDAADSECLVQCMERRAGLDSLAQLSGSPHAHLVLANASLQVRIAGCAPVLLNPCGVLFLNPGDRLVRIAAADEASVADVISIAPEMAARLCRLAGVPQEKPAPDGRLFAAPWAPLGIEEFLQLRLLNRRPQASDYEARLTGWVQRVVNEAAPEWHKRPTPMQEGAERSRFDLIQGVAGYLDAGWRRNVSLAELSQVFGLTSFHLLRAFRRGIGLTPHQYTLQLRLRRSLELIENQRGRGHLADIAAALGFSSHGHFSTAFRKAFGVTPVEYARPTVLLPRVLRAGRPGVKPQVVQPSAPGVSAPGR